MATKNLGKIAFLFKGNYSTATTYLKFDVVFDGKIEFDEMKSRTPITKEFLALQTKTDFQKK